VRLLLARHGQSLWNQVRKFQGANDVGLSDLGRAQAQALGRALRGGYRVADIGLVGTNDGGERQHAVEARVGGHRPGEIVSVARPEEAAGKLA